MTTTYKVLGQLAPSANTASTLYTVPNNNSAVCSTFSVCNAANANAVINVQVAIGNAASSPAQFIINNNILVPGDTMLLTLGITLATGDVIRVESNQANVAFQLFGSEISTT
jgi:hypothetical protein